jgi:hypothetical protein
LRYPLNIEHQLKFTQRSKKMKKLFLLGIGFALAVAVLGVAGFAYAQVQGPSEDPTTEGAEFPYGRGGWGRGAHGGMMAGKSDFAPGVMMGFDLDDGETGPLHDYVWPAVADAFGLTDEQIEAFELVRETVQGIREDLSPEEIQATMQQAMTTAVEDALADGAITEDEAEQWLERLDRMQGLPGMPFGGRGRRGGFQQGFARGLNFGRQLALNHEYLDAAIAEALEISVEELEEMRAEEGFNWKAYAEDQGFSDEEIVTLRNEVFTNAVGLALEDGAITQEQADQLLERLENFEGRGGWFDQP